KHALTLNVAQSFDLKRVSHGRNCRSAKSTGASAQPVRKVNDSCQPLVVKSNHCGGTRNAVSDGAFAATRITTCAFCLGSCYSRMKPPNPSVPRRKTFIYSGIFLKVSRCSPNPVSDEVAHNNGRRRTRPEAPLSFCYGDCQRRTCRRICTTGQALHR